MKRSAIARPAASSAALLIRSPEDSRCSAVPSALRDEIRLRCALSDEMLVLMLRDMRTDEASNITLSASRARA